MQKFYCFYEAVSKNEIKKGSYSPSNYVYNYAILKIIEIDRFLKFPSYVRCVLIEYLRCKRS